MTGSAAARDGVRVFDPDTYVRGVPYEELARLRERNAVVWMEEPAVGPWPAGPGFWAVMRHAEVRSVLRDHGTYSSHLGATQIRDPVREEDLAYVRRMMLNMDPPEHSRLRSLLTKAFTPRAVARLTEGIHTRARALVEGVAERGRADFASEIAADLPLLTLADVFGVPEQDRRLLYDWSNRVIGYQDPEYATSATLDVSQATGMAQRVATLRPEPGEDGRMPDPRTKAGMPDLYAYAHELGAYKREHPGDDVMSILMAQVDDDEGRVSLEEFENLFWLFSVAGNETVRNGLPGGMSALLQHPGQYARLREGPELIAPAVEEMLRWWTPVMHFRRTATRDTELAGTRIKAGDKVVVWYASANRDERVFPDPDRFDVTRFAGGKAAEHLAFGHGPHFCLGSHLAREQLRAMFGAVIEQLAEVVPDGEPVRLRSNFQNGVKHLPIRWQTG